jgi:cobyrinic acid a,c-diamide synthase
VEAGVDLERLWALARQAPPLTWQPHEPAAAANGIRIGVIRDSAFTFYYPENLEALQRLGAKLVELSALSDVSLPPLDALYIGGGYPETHAAALAANHGFRQALRREIERGLPVVAECGGLIYLSEAMIMNGLAHPMVGVFPLTFELGKRPWGHGYASLEAEGDNAFFARGTVVRGHEFRYSYAQEIPYEQLRFAFAVRRGRGFDGERDGLVYKNVLASFTHFHALASPEWGVGVLREARRYHAARLETVQPTASPHAAETAVNA